MEEQEKYSKLTSRKFWLTLWACAVVTGFGLASIITGNDPSWMPGLMAVVASVPVGYVTVGRIKEPKVGK